MSLLQRLASKLFGWKYCSFFYGGYPATRRIFVDKNGDQYCMYSRGLVAYVTGPKVPIHRQPTFH